MISSDYQAKYIVHELERVHANDDVAKLSGLMFDAQITPAPHQVDAALFALNSPNTKGIIMADEVGLGKTIEAGIVVMQYWAERKRKILVISPSSLRQQWSQELSEKFNLPSAVIDSKWLKTHNNFDKAGIYICSYEFANRNAQKLSSGWDLMILDEAHKLRNFYTNKKGIAGSISEIAKWTNKILLLTATPLQNKLEELYGIVSVFDPKYFHSLDVFKQRYIKSDHPYALQDLRDRMSKIAKRTLRKEAERYIKYTNRVAKTVQFTPSGDEQKLYDLVDDYLHRDKLWAFASSQRHLSALILRKRLGSSTFAVASTLNRIVARMEDEYSAGKIRDNRGGLVEFDDLSEEEIEAFEESGDVDTYALDSAKQRAEFRAEIDELKSYADLAESIVSNVKAEHLLGAINIGFQTLESKAARKAIIFTESTITQDYIASVLEREGFAGQYLKFNGQNNSPESNKIYRDWLADNKDTDLITGIESADRRKALIDKFKEDDMQIMIATEAASEGINLQFCSMMINYDLPWNPQRVEQRIGRIHRMGQQFDVVVVNFSNQGNVAEQRILELLADKFNLFRDTFGASNEVLGAIEDGFDFEKTISNILNTCRTDAEITEKFAKLQDEFKDEISSEQLRARAKIFEGLDPHVQDRFKRYDQQTGEAFNSFERMFMDLTQYELQSYANFQDNHIFALNTSPVKSVPTGAYYYKKREQPQHARQYKYSGELAEYVRNTARSTNTPPANLTFSIDQSERVSGDVKKLKGRTGIMLVRSVTFPIKVGQSDMSENYVLASAELDNGDMLDGESCRNILALKVTDVAPLSAIKSSDVLNIYTSRLIEELHGEVKERNTAVYLDKKDLLERQYKDKVTEYEMKEDALYAKIREKERQEKQAPTNAEKLRIAGEIQALRKKRRQLQKDRLDLEDSMEDEIYDKISAAQQASEGEVRQERLFEISFSIT
ncbi:MAG: SNF2-related protein [Candidatus Saccharimonadales bacterium]